MTVKLLTRQHLEFLSLKGGCTGTSESIRVKMLHCWKSHAVAHFLIMHSFLEASHNNATEYLHCPSPARKFFTAEAVTLCSSADCMGS